jgi:hypothetical protein
MMRGFRPADQFVTLLSKRLEAIDAVEESPDSSDVAAQDSEEGG